MEPVGTNPLCCVTMQTFHSSTVLAPESVRTTVPAILAETVVGLWLMALGNVM